MRTPKNKISADIYLFKICFNSQSTQPFDENEDLLNPEMATFIIKNGQVMPYEK